MIIEYKRNGRQKRINPKLGRVLAKKGLVRIVDAGNEYQRRDLTAAGYQTAVVVPEKSGCPELDALRAEADRRGIAYHHRTGAAKLRELLGAE